MNEQLKAKIIIGVDLSRGKDKALPIGWNKVQQSIYEGEDNFAVLTGKINAGLASKIVYDSTIRSLSETEINVYLALV
jgi:hypothetical protein